MLNNRKTGNDAEIFVCNELKKRGHRILQRNFRCRLGEVDIVSLSPEDINGTAYLVFTEVKFRNSMKAGTPEAAVDFRKQQRISRVASFYLTRFANMMDTPVRFDVASVCIFDNEYKISIIENAFDYCM